MVCPGAAEVRGFEFASLKSPALVVDPAAIANAGPYGVSVMLKAVDLPAGVWTTNDTAPGETSNGISKLICAAVTALIGPDVPFTRTETPVVDEPKFAPKTDANVPGLRR